MDQALLKWQEASELGTTERNTSIPREERLQAKARRKELYREANLLAGGYGKLMAELTRRGLITWAF